MWLSFAAIKQQRAVTIIILSWIAITKIIVIRPFLFRHHRQISPMLRGDILIQCGMRHFTNEEKLFCTDFCHRVDTVCGYTGILPSEK